MLTFIVAFLALFAAAVPLGQTPPSHDQFPSGALAQYAPPMPPQAPKHPRPPKPPKLPKKKGGKVPLKDINSSIQNMNMTDAHKDVVSKRPGPLDYKKELHQECTHVCLESCYPLMEEMLSEEYSDCLWNCHKTSDSQC